MPISKLFLRIVRQEDGRFATTAARKGDAPLRIDETSDEAIAGAILEAKRISREQGFRVVVEISEAGRIRRIGQILPPAGVPRHRTAYKKMPATKIDRR